MFIYPLVVAVISLTFGIVVLAQWVQRRRPQQAAWAFSLLLGAAASFAFVGFLADGNALPFRLYYVCGALLVAPYLGMGSLYLAIPRRVADLVLAALLILSALGVALILVAPLNGAALHAAQHNGSPGTGVLKVGLWLALLIPLNAFGAIAVIAVALYSAYKVWRRQAPGRFMVANIVIAAGTFIVAAAGTSARSGLPIAAQFWAIQAIGYVVLFAGFLLTTKIAALAPGRRDIADATGYAV